MNFGLRTRFALFVGVAAACLGFGGLVLGISRAGKCPVRKRFPVSRRQLMNGSTSTGRQDRAGIPFRHPIETFPNRVRYPRRVRLSLDRKPG